jgi:hypothetical protein
MNVLTVEKSFEIPRQSVQWTGEKNMVSTGPKELSFLKGPF